MPFGLLASSNSFSQFLEAVDVEWAIFAISWQVFQHLCQACQHPSVASCPEGLAVVAGGLYFWIDVLVITVIELCLGVEEQAVCPLEALLLFVEEFLVMGDGVELREDGESHVEGI